MIAVDMDGTFLNNDKKYNKARFLKQYEQLKQRNIHFVVASGNQFYTLQNYFPEIKDEIAFIAENGAYVVAAGHELAFAYFSPDLVKVMQDALMVDYKHAMIVCGKKSAYILNTVPEKKLAKLGQYFKKLQHVATFADIDDQICKITLDTTGYKFSQIYSALQQLPFICNGIAKMVSSGFGFIDLLVPNQHKAHGLTLLQQKMCIPASDVLAIGDNLNDLEMIQQVGFGFAIANAVDELKHVAHFVTEKNNEQEAVLDLIDQVLLEETPFDGLHHKTA